MINLNLQVARYLAAVAVAMVVFALAAIIAIALLRGGISTSAPSVVGLFGFIATLVGILASLLQGQATATTAKQIQQQVNGHLQAHMAAAAAAQAGATAEETQS